MRYPLAMRLLWLALVGLGLAQAQLLSYIPHREGFTLGYGSGYLASGPVPLSEAREILFRPSSGAGVIHVQVLYPSDPALRQSPQEVQRALLLASLAACFGDRVCQPPLSLEAIAPGFSRQPQYRVRWSRVAGGQTETWQAYAVSLEGAKGRAVALLIWAEGPEAAPLLQNFWQNTQIEIRP